MKNGDTVIIRGRAFDVLDITSSGDVYVRDVITLELKWVDRWVCGLVDPHKDPGALLEALSHILDEEEAADVQEEAAPLRRRRRRATARIRRRRRRHPALRAKAQDLQRTSHDRARVLVS